MTDISAGQVIDGGVAEVTAIVKTQPLVLPALSVAVQPMYVVPIGKVLPEVALQVMDWIPDPSVAFGIWNVTIAPVRSEGFAVMDDGHVMEGAAVSLT